MKKIILSITLLVIAMSSLQLVAQRNCGTMDIKEIQLKYPEHAIQLQQIETHTQQWIKNSSEHKSAMIVTIPVVFHVIHTGITSPDNNIQDTYILAQLEQLNDDFRRLNSDADNTWQQAADTEIEFCLATTDPDGNPTTGINRYQYSKGTWSRDEINNTIKPATIWDRNNYLNIWLIPDPYTSPRVDGVVLLGYAQFPGGLASTDGVVNMTSTTGSIATPNPRSIVGSGLGRTCTHEVGHWLNLRHIWGDNVCGFDDLVSDTPESDNSNQGCAVGHVSCGSVDMVQNYMDYSHNDCMNLFTMGQKNRMQALFGNGGSRASLLNSQGCTTCNANINVATTYGSGLDIDIEAGNTITANNKILSGANVSYDAGNFIELNPGFHAHNGSIFHAFIDGCDANGNGTCTPTTPTASQIDNVANIQCDFAYGICIEHTGDNKQFELTNLSTGAITNHTTIEHYVPFYNLTQSTNYKYRVRKQCGAYGAYGSWSPYHNFTTLSCKIATDALGFANHPNPFSTQTTIEFDLPKDLRVTITVTDVSGKHITTLLHDAQKYAGKHEVMFDGSNYPAGMYYYTIQAGEYVGTQKMILVK